MSGESVTLGHEDAQTDTRVGHTKADPTDTYVGRGDGGRHMLNVGQPGIRGWLGNPYTLDDYDRADSIVRFRRAFEDKLCRDDEFRAAVAELAGLTLGCWCQRLDADSPACHGEVIAEWADRLASEGEAALEDAQRVMADGGERLGDEGTHWKDQDECQDCGAKRDQAALRAIQLKSGRNLLCIGCFSQALEDGRVHPSDPRVDDHGMMDAGIPNAGQTPHKMEDSHAE